MEYSWKNVRMLYNDRLIFKTFKKVVICYVIRKPGLTDRQMDLEFFFNAMIYYFEWIFSSKINKQETYDAWK